MGRQLKNDKLIGIGAIDCQIEQSVCAKNGVNGYPTLKAMVGGKPKSYNGARETEPMKEWITRVAANRGTKGGSSKCPQGLFKSKVKDAVVPLCEEHFPDDKAKNEWIVIFYESKRTDLKPVMNELALELGNDPPDMNKQLKKPKKRRDRIMEITDKHGLDVKLPAKGPFGMDALAKVGGVCCDCNEDAQAFCASSLRVGEEELHAPQAFWVSKGERKIIRDVELTAPLLAASVLKQLGFAVGGAKEEL